MAIPILIGYHYIEGTVDDSIFIFRSGNDSVELLQTLEQQQDDQIHSPVIVAVFASMLLHVSLVVFLVLLPWTWLESESRTFKIRVSIEPERPIREPAPIQPKLSIPPEPALPEMAETILPPPPIPIREEPTEPVAAPPSESVIETPRESLEVKAPPDLPSSQGSSLVLRTHVDADGSPANPRPSFGWEGTAPPGVPSSQGSSLVVRSHVDPVPYPDNPRPAYPSRARMFGWEGTVLLTVEVLPDGTTGRIEIAKSSGYDELDRAAVTAIRQWRFKPAEEGQAAIAQTVEIPVRFVLNE